MIQVIYGKRGSGKSKRMVSLANEQVKSAKGTVVYIDDDNRAIHELDRHIRFINTEDFELKDYKAIYGFLSGIISTNYDVETIFVDGLFNTLDKKDETTEKVFNKLQQFSEKHNVNLMITMHDEGELGTSDLEKFKVI
ncbi:ATP-binding protein [Youngiibacter multivorans]|jgi:ABC-type lipoprotein export system ATPase subunit|uniref:ABC-type lipoprotein export system ATPase subunit n=1 Tax=Youngiibacter multivorans TaxID=937251 RepID=A0ABS4G697_9CLOT|nr:ATP-binding protein [Youngiibacter multivorans]MBP1919805.1 ABC-type lipoprotein export system ATPase subunit [Youngiibacter multivorans]MBW8383300.1 ATP-binding protein [Youngiibacter sp.]